MPNIYDLNAHHAAVAIIGCGLRPYSVFIVFDAAFAKLTDDKSGMTPLEGIQQRFQPPCAESRVSLIGIRFDTRYSETTQ